ncbi:MAG TPA: hypothetical protein VG013_00985 [Gemmataceae bacterium]|nr:hypothetical protein [Gemmataceae bacterium]
MKTLLAFGLMLVFAASAAADGGDDTLRFFLSKSDLVVVGTVTSDPAGVEKEAGVVNYHCRVAVSEVLKGKVSTKGELAVNIIRFESAEEDKLPYLKKGAKCILFLKSADPKTSSWETADVWFGVQQFSPWMARSLKRLAGQ